MTRLRFRGTHVVHDNVYIACLMTQEQQQTQPPAVNLLTEGMQAEMQHFQQ